VSIVVQTSACEIFTPRELRAALQEFLKRGPQRQDDERGVKAAAYCFGERVLLVYEESETDVMVLIQRSAWK
jgi:hypothetical protein